MTSVYTVPDSLLKTLLSYVKKTYLPEKRINPKTADEFTSHDIKFFARGAAEMSAYFTSERAHLPKNYLNKKELRAGYLLYFVPTNFLKVRFCLEELRAGDPSAFRPQDDTAIKILDIGCGPGTASLACADFWRNSSRKIEITAVDQNTNALRDAKKLFQIFAGENVSLKTVYNNIRTPHPRPLPSGERGRGEGVNKFDIIIAANFLSEAGDIRRQQGIVEGLLAHHLNENGIVIIIEPALRWTTRNLMKLRDLLLSPSPVHRPPPTVLSPCLHSEPCPMLKAGDRDWCHIYLDWKRPDVIAKIDALIGNRKDYLKFSYLIFSHYPLPITHHNLFRAVSAPMRSKGKTELVLCSKKGLLRIFRLDKNASPLNSGLDAVKRGDLVSLEGGPAIGKDSAFKILNLSNC